jgi:hypothetical protein
VSWALGELVTTADNAYLQLIRGVFTALGPPLTLAKDSRAEKEGLGPSLINGRSECLFTSRVQYTPNRGGDFSWLEVHS